MKAFINYVPHLEESIDVKDRCFESCEKFGLDPHPVPCVWRDDAMQAMEDEGLKLGKFADHLSKTESVVGNFITNYRLWKMIKRPALILEHDAVVVAPIPKPLWAWPEITTIGKPSFGSFGVSKQEGLQEFFSNKALKHFKGAHAYIITPAGAHKAIEVAEKVGVLPLDIFFHTERFTLHELYPWPVEARDTFTTIQNESGCEAKHNWNADYAIY